MNINVRVLVVAAIFAALGLMQPGTATASLPAIHGLTAEAGADGPVIHLRTDHALETVHYSPQPGVWVVEMPEADWEPGAGALSEPALGIERAELTEVEEFGKRITRLTVWLEEPSQLRLDAASDGTNLVFSSFAAVAAASEPSGPEPVVLNVTPVDPVPAPEPEAETAVAVNLFDLVPSGSGDGAVIELKGDGALTGTAFTLPDPDRLVVDLQGVIKRFDRSVYNVDAGPIRRVRVAQNRTEPEPVTRVVVDLDGEIDYRFDETANGAVIRVAAVGATISELVVTETEIEERPDVVIAEAAPQPSTTVEEGSIAITPSSVEVASSDAFVDEFVEDDAPPQQDIEWDDGAAVAERSPFVADASQMIEQAPAAQVLDAPTTRAETFKSTEVTTEEQQFTGEPISLSLKDADVRDVLKTFSALTQLNIIVDPGVGGSVTVELRDVPWDQALDLILRINNLDYVLENNVLRVATTQKLASEKQAKIQLEKQMEEAKPLKTVLKPLSYAKASYIAGLLSSDSYLLSDRGTVTTDERTNTLIIRDVVDRVEGALRLIDSLDQPTPQVVIEGRIVETTRDFSRELGISWGFDGVMDAAHGNDTGLDFPNSITAAGGVELARGNQGFLSFSFGDILNTFNLDFLLQAAETHGLTRIVSTPRVTTQNLQQASIRSGLQIPVQTIANNTVTVQYVDATLRLQVTPQITAEGTVNLDVDIKKQEPVLASAVTGGNNVPIFTRDAQTQLLVRDGGTTVIAGIYQINDQINENMIPGLHKIPVFGNLFKNKGDFKRHDELLIFITPRIVKY
ncbi:MAG: type IV pilus secretin PilQ [Thermoanaerobaculales bacterium]|nr:type IV pilus secretin PilQ [Thermoanaerobaculales bacterium]